MNSIKGWTTVFNFTFIQNVKKKSYITVTALIAVLIIAGICLVFFLDAKPDDDETSFSQIEQVYILDESGFKNVQYVLQEENSKTKLTTYNDKTLDELKTQASQSNAAMVVHITKTDDGFSLEGILPENCEFDADIADNLLNTMSANFKTSVIAQSNLSEKQLTELYTPVTTFCGEVGESKDMLVSMLKIFAPFMFGMLLYILVMLHSETVANEVSAEKTSKLVESILTCVKPYSLILGKITAVVSMILLQFLIWIVSIVAGIFIGNKIAVSQYPDYDNTIMTFVNFLKSSFGESALSPLAIILAFAFICIGFLFFSTFAGIAGSIVSKPEELASFKLIYTIPLMIGYFIVIFSSIGNGAFSTFANFFPISSPLLAPAKLLIGTMSISNGLISIFILLISSLLLVLLSAKLYKGLIMYHGENFSLKKALSILKSEK